MGNKLNVENQLNTVNFDLKTFCDKLEKVFYNECVKYCKDNKKKVINDNAFAEISNRGAKSFINEVIIPTVGSESDILFWESVLKSIDNINK